MSFMRKAGVATLAAGTVFTGIMATGAHAGTGGNANAGVIYGQDAAYCDAQGVSLSKADAATGNVLSGAGFTVTNPDGQMVGVKAYSGTVSSTQVAADRVAWQNAFNTSIDNSFAATALGANWLKAEIATGDPRSGSVASDTDPTVYIANQSVLFPADLTGITDAQAKANAMQAWPTMAASAGQTSTVSAFAAALQERVNAITAVYNDPIIQGSDSYAQVAAAYNAANAEMTNLMNALHAAGYTNATIDPATGALTAGAFNGAAQNSAAFDAAYKAMTTPGAFPFGIQPATYDVIANAIGAGPLLSAQQTADAAAGATDLGNTGSVALPATDATGAVSYVVFGRNTAITGAGTLDKTCAQLTTSSAETTAPVGYAIDNTAAVAIAPLNSEDAVATQGYTDTLQTSSVPGDKPVAPQFESGV